MIKADLHNHLGRKGVNPGFDETVDLAYGRLGSNSMFGIANSNDFRYEKFVEQSGGKYNRQDVEDKRAVYVPEKKILIVKCQEMFTNQGHVLAIAMPYGREVTTKEPRDSIREAKDMGAILDAVHPFSPDGIGEFLSENPKLLLEYFSSWEVHNGSAEFWFPIILPIDANLKALEFYIKEIKPNLKIGMSSSTDGHLARTIGKCYTELKDFDLTSLNLVNELDSKLREVKSEDKLHRESNTGDAALHTFYMGLERIKKQKKLLE